VCTGTDIPVHHEQTVRERVARLHRNLAAHKAVVVVDVRRVRRADQFSHQGCIVYQVHILGRLHDHCAVYQVHVLESQWFGNF